MPDFVQCLSVSGHYALFTFLTAINSIVTNTHVQVFVLTHVFSSTRYTDTNPRTELPGQRATLFKPEQLQNERQSLPATAP